MYNLLNAIVLLKFHAFNVVIQLEKNLNRIQFIMVWTTHMQQFLLLLHMTI